MNEQKKLAMEKTSNNWILNIDADERVTPELRNIILDILENPEADGYRIPRKNFFLGKWMKYGGWFPDHVLRLFHKEHACYGGINPHDKVIIKTGNIKTLKEPLLHYTYNSFSQYITRQSTYSSQAALELYRRGKKQIPLLFF